jgi:hypothetical protein
MKRRDRIPATTDAGAPNRELDDVKNGERAKAPPNLIRKPLQLPPMRPVKQ